MRERPSIPRRRASLYSCSFVRPFGLLVPERSPPRRPDEMSRVDERDAVLDSPLRARSLFTVAAAICFARFVVRRFAVERFAVLRFAVERFAVRRFAVLRFAVERFAVRRFAVLRFAVERFAVLRF